MKFRIPPNEALVEWIAEQADPPVRRIRLRSRVANDALRCHPDLRDRLESAAAGLPGVRLRYLTEGAIGRELAAAINTAQSGESISIAALYLGDRDIVRHPLVAEMLGVL